MHRQSVGSPPPNNHQSHVIVKDITTTTTALTPSPKAFAFTNNYTEQKPQKKLHRPERFIHFIPILTVLCFLILYLSSHDPSQKELAQFNGFKRLQKPIDNSFDGMKRITEVKKSDSLAIRILRNVEELEKEEMRLKDQNRLFLGRN